jgi:hypothetical protein
MSEIQVTFQKLREAGPYVQKWLEEGAKLGPVMADIVVQIAKFMSVFSESGNVLVFFSTIRNVVKGLADIMQNKFISTIVGVITQISAFGLAFKTVVALFKFFVGKIIIGGLMAITFQFNLMKATMLGVRAGAIGLGAALKLMAPPVIMAISLIVMAFIEIKEAAKRARQEAMGSLDDLNAKARSTAYDGMDLLTTSFGDLKGSIDTMNLSDQSENFGHLRIEIDQITDSSTNFKTALALLTTQSGQSVKGLDKVFRSVDEGTEDTELVAEAFANVGSSLAELARTSLPMATKKFQDIARAQQLSKEEQMALLLSMPELNIAMGQGEGYADAVATQLYGVGGAAKAAKERIQGLKDEIFNFGSVTLDTRAAQREFERAIDDVTKSVIENGKGLDITTEAGRNNSAALDSLVTSGKDFANSMFEQNGNAAELQTNMENLRTKVKNAAIEMGVGKTAAEKLADQLVGSKYELNIKIKAITKEQVTTATAELKKIVTDAGKAGFRVTAADLARLYPELVAVAGAGAKTNKRYGGYINAFSAGVPRFAPGGPVFGSGTGTSDSIPAMLSNGEFVVNANATAKNRSLLETINSGNQSVSGGNNISIVVNPGPGMDVKELASEVSRRLAFTMRKGAAV